MRWKGKHKVNHKEAKLKRKKEDKRIVRVFLFFPLKLEDEWRWLERATIEQWYIETVYYDYGIPYIDGRWVDMFYRY